jgi:hypothetical protein
LISLLNSLFCCFSDNSNSTFSYPASCIRLSKTEHSQSLLDLLRLLTLFLSRTNNAVAWLPRCVIFVNFRQQCSGLLFWLPGPQTKPSTKNGTIFLLYPMFGLRIDPFLTRSAPAALSLYKTPFFLSCISLFYLLVVGHIPKLLCIYLKAFIISSLFCSCCRVSTQCRRRGPRRTFPAKLMREGLRPTKILLRIAVHRHHSVDFWCSLR